MTIATDARSPRATFNRSQGNQAIPATLAPLEREVTEAAMARCERALDASAFFRALDRGEVTPEAIKYVFGQYGHYRLQLHTWFGLCLVKARDASDPAQRIAIMALADHIFTDLRDNHDAMFGEMLEQLGLGPGRLHGEQPSAATQSYIRSFFEDFAGDEHDFFTALAALSGRELAVSIRNQRILRSYFEQRGLTRPRWLALHAELEIEHFLDAVRPVILRYGEASCELTAARAAIAGAIERHVAYFDALWIEHPRP